MSPNVNPYVLWWARLCGAAGALLLSSVVLLAGGNSPALCGVFFIAAGCCRAWGSLILWSESHDAGRRS